MKPFDQKKILSVLWILLPLASIFYAWNEFVTSAHFYRQAQTAQTIDIYLKEGFSLLYPKLRFCGQPGIVILEFPLFQFFSFLLSKYLYLSLDFTSRLLSLGFSLGFIAMFSKVYKEIFDERLSSLYLLVFFSTPLLFSLTTWVTIETLLLFLWVSTFYFYIRILKSKNTRSLLMSGAFFSGLASLSMLIKPNPLFGIFPLCLYLLFSLKEKFKEKFITIAGASILGAIPFLLWMHHVQNVEKIYENPFSIRIHYDWYFLHWDKLNAFSLSKLISRILVYVLGIGALIVLIKEWLSQKKTRAAFLANDGKVLKFAALGAVLYLVAFLHLNLAHNYYQVPLLLPLGIILFRLLSKLTIKPAYLWLVILINVGISFSSLAKFDHDWSNFLKDAQVVFKNDNQNSNQDLSVYDPADQASPLLSYYLGRYTKLFRFEFQTAEDVKQDDLIFVCTKELMPQCRQRVLVSFPECQNLQKEFGALWTCIISR